MRLLLDTHALLWFLVADRRLSRHARSLIDAPANTVAVSVTTLPGGTDVIEAPPEVMVRDVVVAGGTPHNETVPEALAS